jgi:Insertion element 4 transposase N-terminal/Transposase DDE domain
MSVSGPTVAGLSINFNQIIESIPLEIVKRVLEATKTTSERVRKLPAHLMVYYSIAAGLMASESSREVLRQLMRDVQDQFLSLNAVIASRAAISMARQRLGPEAIRQLFEAVVRPIAKLTTEGAWFRHLRLVAIDGSSLHIQDTPANRKRYGKAHAVKGKTGPFPLIRFVALCEIGTHVLFAARMGAWRVGEVTLAKQIVDRLEPGMLCLADRLFYGFELWNQAVASGAQLLWRVQKSIRLPRLQVLADGSYLSEVRANSRAKVADRERRVTVRVIEFHISVGDKRKDYRVITTLLDPRKAPALELANLYARRWGIETAFAELKTHLRGSGVLLRSQLPELVEQDFYGLLLAHFGVRSIMHEAAREQRISPTELSFVHAVRVVIRRLPEMVSFSPLWWLPDDPSAACG